VESLSCLSRIPHESLALSAEYDGAYTCTVSCIMNLEGRCAQCAERAVLIQEGVRVPAVEQ
jgi:hypothetical protein